MYIKIHIIQNLHDIKAQILIYIHCYFLEVPVKGKLTSLANAYIYVRTFLYSYTHFYTNLVIVYINTVLR